MLVKKLWGGLGSHLCKITTDDDTEVGVEVLLFDKDIEAIAAMFEKEKKLG